MSSDIKLLPCPFCGGKAKIGYQKKKLNRDEIFISEVRCSRCFVGFMRSATTNSGHIMAEQQVIEDWNTRKPMDRIVEQLEEDRTCRCRLEGYIPKWKAIEVVKAGGKE